mgnify:CR=1 FL=1
MVQKNISLFLIFFFSLLSVYASELKKIENATLVKNPSNDGDSFRAKAGGKQYYLRLYFVDTAETSAQSPTMARRVREQTRYFGLEDYTTLIAMGKKATEFTRKKLSEPFTFYTTFAHAGGRSNVKRIYAFIETANGKNLAELLVRNGLARAYGVGRENHKGVSMDEQDDYYSDLQIEAMLKRKGVWKYADAEKIVALRAEQRNEERELKDIASAAAGRAPGSKINLNEASKDALMLLQGIGPKTADRIIANRPYLNMKELDRVKGIGKKTIQRIEDQIVFSEDEKEPQES